MNNSIKFLLIFFLSATQVFLLIGGFNWWVDPYGVYHPKEYKAKSPIWMSKQLRLAKAYRVQQLKPLGIVIGASTSQLGIDPSHLGWDENRLLPATTYRYRAQIYTRVLGIISMPMHSTLQNKF